MADDGDVCVLIPTLNEEETIGSVVDGFRDRGLENVFVIDGRSTDDTRAVARDHGARVTVQSGAGKGQAVREAIDDVDAEFVLLVDGDGTYDPADADAMLEPLREGRAEHVIGNRFADMAPDAMSRLNRFGNRVIDRLFAALYGTPTMDILSGYRAFTLDSIRRLSLTAEGFGIETEMAAECARLGVATEVVPISYSARPDGSATNLRPFRDGGRILLTMFLRTKTSNPLVYFGLAGGASMTVGSLIAAYVGVEWVTRQVSHEVMAVVAAFAIIVGVQLFMFGALSDLIVTLHREQLDRIEDD
ncbi:MAG: S-layer glycoprotein N-glycosyltransferase AglJ [Halobacteriaceae archaeon]